MILEKRANGQSCLNEIEFDIGAATACFSFFLIELVLDWVKQNGVMLTFLGQDTLKSV